MDICDLAPPYIRAIAPYQPGKPISELVREMGLDEAGIVKLASNENPMGVSPLARVAIDRAAGDLARYPDGNGFELKRALSAHHGVAPERIVLGNGSNDVLEMAARAFLAPGLEAVYSQHAFAVYPLVVQAMGASGVEVPARNFAHDLAAMRRAVSGRTRVVFIANPNNPTGTLAAPAELESFIASVPREVLVVLDEAYYEYLPAELRADSVAWLERFPHLVVTRTFSKIYGLAGLRVGYAFAAPAVADLMNRVRQPFNVNSVSLAAATAALSDAEFVRKGHELNRAGMREVTAGLKRIGLEFIPSHGNFVSFRVGDAATVYRKLLESGVIVRPISSYGLPQHLRVTIGLEAENARFLAALDRALKA
ncbi:MAG: histidinol-phosphate transaminase [Betaproteobacteria bacterium]|nr:histidinol-phosphate transaminase [Betaproteobacteria bacterium]